MKVPDNAPLTDTQKAGADALLAGLSSEQATWLSGFFGGVASSGTGAAPAVSGGTKLPVTILFGTESGNAESLAEQTKKTLSVRGMKPTVLNMADTEPAALKQVENLLVIVSTWGDGDPPDAAVPFVEAITADSAPKLNGVSFSVCALGDTSYEQFCKTGKDFDTRLEALGANRLAPRVDCDIDFDDAYAGWLETALKELDSKAGSSAPATPAASPAVASGITYGKKNPFPSELLERVVLNGEGSIKETLHLEFSLEGSGMTYEVGDALAVVPTNCPDDVEAFLKTAKLTGDEPVTPKGGSEKPLREALTTDFDITGLTKNVLKKYNDAAADSKIGNLLDPGNKEALQDYLWGRQPVDMLEDFHAGLDAPTLAGLLRKMPPRLYSIASSLKAHPDEVHLTIAAVRYHSHGRDRKGVASTYCADRLALGGSAPVYTHANKNFKLPDDTNAPVIMVGPGTGIAPFRAFVEERAATGAKGKNWLFFGDQHYSYDFLYQLEWQDYLKDGVLNRLDAAFSRDQPEKVYVQHKMAEQSRDLYAWLEEGAHFYVCGDASRMAHDVHEALVTAVEKESGRSKEEAGAYIDALKKTKRYQRDVY